MTRSDLFIQKAFNFNINIAPIGNCYLFSLDKDCLLL